MEWSYDFSTLGYACATTLHAGAKLSDSGTDSHGSNRVDVLMAAFDRMVPSGNSVLRVLDLGAGSGSWLSQARKELEGMAKGVGGRRRGPWSSANIHLHRVTGDALSSEIRADGVELFQRVGIEVFPPQLGSAAGTAPMVDIQRFAQTVETALEGGPGYDLIVSSWTFCHLIDPLATLEIWSNALAVGGELYLNDIDFLVMLEGDSPASTEGTQSQKPLNARAADAGIANLEMDPEKRMQHAFDALNAKGADLDHGSCILHRICL